jgi:mannosyl-oligosaccharide alpha-1,2-mannosidase
VAAAESSIEHLASHPSSRPDLTYLAVYDGHGLGNTSQHLACFAGGSFLLGGAVLGRQGFVDFGLALTDACHHTYRSDLTGIGPETFSWDTARLPADQTPFYRRHGFWIASSLYDLRPEVLESLYYAYRVTKDPKYQDWAWDAFVAINATTRTASGFGHVTDVNAARGGTAGDNQESFLFAEVMKYAYLIHAPVGSALVRRADDGADVPRTGRSRPKAAASTTSFSTPRPIRSALPGHPSERRGGRRADVESATGDGQTMGRDRLC